MKSKLFKIVLLAAAIFVVFMSGCDDRTTSPNQNRVVTLGTSATKIYCGNDSSTATITAKVLNENNTPVSDITVFFRTSAGTIVGSAATNIMGEAVSVLRPKDVTIREDEEFVTAKVEAYLDEGLDGRKSVEVQIHKAPVVIASGIVINCQSQYGIETTNAISATVVDTSLTPLPDGTILTFSTTKGEFSKTAEEAAIGNTLPVQITNGTAKCFFRTGTLSGDAIIKVSVSDTMSATKVTKINPGSPQKIDIIVEPAEIPVNSGMTSNVTVAVMDRFRNPIETPTQVIFSSFTLDDQDNEVPFGSITPIDETNEEGVAEAIFSPGVTAGIGTIRAVADSAVGIGTIRVTSEGVSSIRFTQTDIINLDVRNTGGIESAPLNIQLLDGNGNLVETDEWVYFMFATEPPDGATINGNEYAADMEVAVRATNGQASITVGSGPKSGIVSIKAVYRKDGQDDITAVKNNIIIQAGPPDQIDIEAGEYDSASEYEGTGLWQLGVTATVVDKWENPVADGTAVWFSLVDPQDEDDIEIEATIIASAYTRNLNTESDSLPGQANTIMIYDGSYTNYIVTVRAEAGEIFFEQEIKLPLNSPALEMFPNIGHVDFYGPTPTVPAVVEVNMELSDNLGNYISMAVIECWSERGLFDQPDPDFQIPGYSYGPAGFTGTQNNIVWTNQDGRAKVRIKFELRECPPPPPGAEPQEQNVQINAQIAGTDSVDNIQVLLLRYEAPNP